MAPARKLLLLVCDSWGIGAAADAPAYGDAGADTLGHVAAAVGGLCAPNLAALGLGRLVDGVGPGEPATEGVAWASLAPRAAGKDSTTGHWELTGLVLQEPFPTYPDGFPAEVVERFERAIDRGVLANRAGSGTAMVERFGAEHVATGEPILYTSGDSVFQLAAHTDVVPLETLYDWCSTARAQLAGEHAVGRVIARPFEGADGSFERTSGRRDLPLPPPSPTYLDVISGAGVPVLSVGKVADLFDRRGILRARRSRSNDNGVDVALELLAEPGPVLVVANLCDFDTDFGHRQDPVGYARAIEQLDARVPELIEAVGREGLLLVTGDHGCDPTDDSTDHTRERTPLLLAGGLIEGRRSVDLGERAFADVGATIADMLGQPAELAGTSFAAELGIA